MRAVLDEARRREHVVSALMPFRASFYERFGYGIVEKRVEWTVPTSLLPQGPADLWRHATAADAPAQKSCRQRAVEMGQCDIVRTEAGWRHIEPTYESALIHVHATGPANAIDARVILSTTIRHERDVLVVEEFSADSPAALLSILHFLGKFSDQYHAVQITLPADFPLNRVLRQTQLPHRRVAHAFATARPFTRMQLRVLNHRRLIESMLLPPHAPFATTIAIRESEGTITRLQLQYESGHATVTDGPNDEQFACNDTTWAAIVCGDLRATTAVRLGLAIASGPAAANLDIFAAGPVPFCNEYF
jgi:predicted acetyltransferase